MHRFFALLNLHCRLATRLISDALERPLSRLEQLGLGIHLLGCCPCRRYRGQLLAIEKLIKAICSDPQSPDGLSAVARQRIGERLRSARND